MNKFLQGLFVFMFFAGVAMAQNRTITGTVTASDDKMAIPGVSVKVKGTNTGAMTDGKGNFTVKVAEGNTQLEFSFIGYQTKLVNLTSSNVVDVVLNSDAKNLSEVVVVAYGQQSKALTTQTLAVVKSESFKNLPVQSPQQILQGQTAGVNMVNSSGVLGAEAQITVRGGSSISGAGRPLYVVDGVPLNSAGSEYTQDQGGSSGLNPLLNINANDIESMTVLKDAAAISIYGSRGANGVVLITTKRGSNQKTRINVDYYNGFNNPTATEDMMNADQWRQFRSDYLRANGSTVPTYSSESYDWKDAVIRTGQMNNVNVSAAGGDEKTQFYVGGTFNKESGYTLGNDLKRLSGRFNLNHKVSDKINIGINYNLSNVDMNRIGAENSTAAPLTAAYLQLPFVTPYGADGRFQNTGFVANVLAIAETGINKNYSKRSTGNAFVEWKILDGLKFKSDWGIDEFSIDEKFREVDLLTPGGYAYRTHNTDNKWLSTNTLNYDKSFGKNKIGALAGYSFETSTLNKILVEGSGFASDKLPNVGSASTPITASEDIYDWALESQFMRLNYGYDNKYLLEGSFRRDGSSRFGPGFKYDVFYAISGGWIVSNEAFFNKDNNFVNFLKLTASYGTAGNDDLGFYPYMTTYSSGANYSGLSGLIPNKLGNNKLTWERTKQFDLGLTTRLFRAIDLQVNYYNKISDGMLLNVTLPYTTGFSTRPMNIGVMRNRGWEFSISSENIKSKDFNWRTSFNIAFNKNTILELPKNADEDGRNFVQGSTEQRAVEGHSRNSFYLIRYKGINPETGNAEWFKKDGSVTSNPTASDRVIAGKADPTFQGGITNTFKYKNFDLSAFFNFSYGNDVFIDGLTFTDNFSSGSYNKSVKMLDYWKQPGDNAFAPALNSPTKSTYAQVSTKQLLDGSYLRLKSLTIGYNIPTAVLERTKFFKSVRVYALAQNILTFKNSEFRGDPEISANGANNAVMGQSFFALPQPKSFTFGVNIGL